MKTRNVSIGHRWPHFSIFTIKLIFFLTDGRTRANLKASRLRIEHKNLVVITLKYSDVHPSNLMQALGQSLRRRLLPWDYADVILVSSMKVVTYEHTTEIPLIHNLFSENNKIHTIKMLHYLSEI